MDNDQPDALKSYYKEAETWAVDRRRRAAISQRVAWMIAIGASTIAIFEAIALVALTPLKTLVPYTLLVDKQTGYIQALKPLDREVVAPDASLTRSLLAQYVLAREGFDINSLREDYRKVALWSEGEARQRYDLSMQASNPSSPLASLPRQAVVQAEIRSISSLNNSTAMVRFTTTRTDPGGRKQTPQAWAAVIKYRFTQADMSAADRLINPLGFQVQRYRRDAEIPPAPSAPEISSASAATRLGSGYSADQRFGPRVLPNE